MLDCLDVDEKKRLRCNTHPTFAAVQAIYMDFNMLNQLLELKNIFLLELCIAFQVQAIQYGTFVFWPLPKRCLCLIVACQTVWKEDVLGITETSELSAELIVNGFVGFSSNRFKRIGELPTLMKKRMDIVI